MSKLKTEYYVIIPVGKPPKGATHYSALYTMQWEKYIKGEPLQVYSAIHGWIRAEHRNMGYPIKKEVR